MYPGDCPVVPDTIGIGWLWDTCAEGGPALVLYARWKYHHKQIEATWENGTAQVTW